MCIAPSFISANMRVTVDLIIRKYLLRCSLETPPLQEVVQRIVLLGKGILSTNALELPLSGLCHSWMVIGMHKCFILGANLLVLNE